MDFPNAATTAAICLLCDCDASESCMCDGPSRSLKEHPQPLAGYGIASDEITTSARLSACAPAVEAVAAASASASAAHPGHRRRGFRYSHLRNFVRRYRVPRLLTISLLVLLAWPVTWLHHHFTIMRSGESPHMRVEFSLIVAVSSLLYLAVAYAFWINACPVLAAVFTLVTISSLFTDSLHTSSRFWPRVDRFLATCASESFKSLTLLGPIRAMAFYCASAAQRAEVAALSLLSLSCLAWSRKSRCQWDFVVRHSTWHLVSAVSLLYLANSVEFA
ncbi:unnamed protein product [Closterium sp. NIES-54]